MTRTTYPPEQVRAALEWGARMEKKKKDTIRGLATAESLRLITIIRAKNNDLWMGILQVALESNPKETRKLLKGIGANDRKVTKLMSNI